jgi:Ca2+-binding RTX toxin-like protein
MTKALTAFAMQAYYTNRLAVGKTLFENITGGLRFDRSKVAEMLEDPDPTDDNDQGAKGYALYFKNYLATIPASDRHFIEAILPNLLDWFIQTGSGGMTATAGDQRAFMLGGSGSDNLTGGSQADVLVGNGGSDYLTGGGSYDLHVGGAEDYFRRQAA